MENRIHMGNIKWQLPRHRAENEGEERNATWLELFYDLIYVAIIIQLSHHLAANLNLQGLKEFGILFTAVWIIWINSTFYNNRFESDDFRHRFFTFIKMLPMLGITQGASHISGGGAYTFAISYLLTRGIILYLWYSAGKANSEVKLFTNKFVIGHFISVSFWIASLFVKPEYMMLFWIAGEIIDILLPAMTLKIFNHIPKLNYPHVTERFGLFTIIVLGEGIISIINALSEIQYLNIREIALAGISFTIIFAIWFIYVENINKRSFRENSVYMYFWWILHLPLMISIVLLENSMSQVIQNANFFKQNESILLFIAVGMVIFFTALIESISKYCCDKEFSCTQLKKISRKKFERKLLLSIGSVFSGYLSFQINTIFIMMIVVMILSVQLLDNYFLKKEYRNMIIEN